MIGYRPVGCDGGDVVIGYRLVGCDGGDVGIYVWR